MFSAIGQTAIDENGFKEQRHEERRSSNARMSHHRRWSALILSGVASKKYEYGEVHAWRDEVL